MTETTIDVLDPALWADPHGALARARSAGPLARTADRAAMLLRYDDVDAALRHPDLDTFSVQSLLDHNGIADGPLREWCDLLMLSLEGADHARLRGLVSRAFTPRRVEAARAGARAFVRELLASGSASASGSVDWVHDVAHELPVWVMCEMLGVPSDDRHLFKEWTVDLALTFANVLTVEERTRAEHALTSLYGYVRELVAERRDRPGDDLLGALVEAELEGQRLSSAELEAMVVNLLQGGHETTRSSLSIALERARTTHGCPLRQSRRGRSRDAVFPGIRAVWVVLGRQITTRGLHEPASPLGFMATLLAHPAELDRLHDDPSLVANAVEELLRYESPTFSTMRVARRSVALGPIVLEEGEPVHLSLLAANRDPDRFDRAGVLDVGRAGVRHVSFGSGAHHCIGAALARLELQEALAELVVSCRDITLEIAAPVWVPYLQVRRIEALPISFRRAA